MAIKTYTEQLEEVQAAITAIMTGGQEYTIGSRSYKAADLETLRKFEADLRIRADRETNNSGGIRIRGATPV